MSTGASAEAAGPCYASGVKSSRHAVEPFFLGVLTGALAALGVRRAFGERDGPPRARVGPALDGMNDDFHASYEGARERTELDAPVFVVLADELVLVRRGRRQAFSFSPRLFHVIKSAAHGPVALYASLYHLGDAPLGPPARARVAALRGKIAGALSSIDGEPGPRAVLDNLRKVLQASLAFVDGVLTSGRVSAEGLRAFAASTGPALLRGADDATRVQLEALDAHVARALATMSPEERRGLQVVVTGDHQARARSLAMQYFQKLFDEAPGEEHRVTYAEGVSDEAGALALVGTRRLDRAIASAFFGEPRRLQRDVLGDAACERLRDFTPVRPS